MFSINWVSVGVAPKTEFFPGGITAWECILRRAGATNIYVRVDLQGNGTWEASMLGGAHHWVKTFETAEAGMSAIDAAFNDFRMKVW